MPRQARLFTSSAGSAVRGYLKFRANIPPRWIKNARGSRKRIEPEIAEGFRSLQRLRIRRPRARVAIRNAQPVHGAIRSCNEAVGAGGGIDDDFALTICPRHVEEDTISRLSP
jgi:hypothetical protein